MPRGCGSAMPTHCCGHSTRSVRAKRSAHCWPVAGGAAHAVAAIETEDRAAVMDSLILCKFLRGVFAEPFDEWAELLRAVTGWDVDGAELHATARRIVLAKRAFNAREGATRDDDWLPERFLSEEL